MKGSNTMKSSTKILLIIGGIILLLGIVFASTYNGLVSAEAGVESAYANIETDLQRRSDLIPNLVETVKAYASHEKEVFTAVSDARANLAGAQNPEELANANEQMDSALSRLLVISEAYPELKANENFINLQDELAGTENRIAVSRKDYNDVAKDYNTAVKSFPKNLIAGMFGFEEKEYFEASEDAQEVPDVNFE